MSQSHGSAVWQEAAKSGATPSVSSLRLVAAPVEGVMFSADLTVPAVGSLVANGTEGYDVTLADFAADLEVVNVLDGAMTY